MVKPTINKTCDVVVDDTLYLYNVKGIRINTMQKGINLVRMSDNTVKKVLVK